MDMAIQGIIPSVPPTEFIQSTETDYTDTWLGNTTNFVRETLGRGFSDSWTSSSKHGTLEYFSKNWLQPISQTSSRTAIAESVKNMIDAETRESSITAADASENVFELRRLTGFSWVRLAEFLNVDRRTLNNWVNGSEIRTRNRKHIDSALAVLHFIDRGTAEDNCRALETRISNSTAFELIRTERYYQARSKIGPGPKRFRSPKLSNTDWIREHHPITIHEDADGTESIELLTSVPKPQALKRQLKRG